MMETLHVMGRSCKRMLPCEEKELDGSLRSEAERGAKAKVNRPYLERNHTTITVVEKRRAV